MRIQMMRSSTLILRVYNAMHHHFIKCLHSLQRQGEKQIYKTETYKKMLLKTIYTEINIIRINLHLEVLTTLH